MVHMTVVRTVAKRFVFRQPAAAQAQGGAALQSVLVALCIYNNKIAFYFEGSVGVNCNFCGRHDVVFNFRQGKDVLIQPVHRFRKLFAPAPFVVEAHGVYFQPNLQSTGGHPAFFDRVFEFFDVVDRIGALALAHVQVHFGFR